MKTYFFIGLSLMCLLLMAIGYFLLSNGNKTGSWPYVKGIIVKSELEKKDRSTGTKLRSNRTTYTAFIDYEYEVNGKLYHNNTITYKMKNSNSIGIQRKYTLNKEVQVFYSPENPNKSVLEPGVSKGNYYLVFVPMFALLIIFILIIKDLLVRLFNRPALSEMR